jgi:hypothetical protein
MLHEMQHRYDRLLDMPRTSVPPQTAQEARGATQPLPPPRSISQAATAPQ